jgi:hypothetical protein
MEFRRLGESLVRCREIAKTTMTFRGTSKGVCAPRDVARIASAFRLRETVDEVLSI